VNRKGINEEIKRKSRKGHRKRLREKFLRAGLAGLLDYEVVELLLSVGTPRKDCKEPAKAALRRFKNLAGVLDASDEQLAELPGIGRKNIIGLRLVKDAGEEYLKIRARGATLAKSADPLADSPRAVHDYLVYSLAGEKKESFKVLFLNNANRLITCEDLFEGTVDCAAVYPREVVESALKHNATRLVFAHNHPAGTLQPSQNDRELTSRLARACQAVGIEVLDHVIIGAGGYYSFRENRLL